MFVIFQSTVLLPVFLHSGLCKNTHNRTHRLVVPVIVIVGTMSVVIVIVATVVIIEDLVIIDCTIDAISEEISA